MIRPRLIAVALFAVGAPLALAIVAWRASWWPLAIAYGALILSLIAVDALLGLRVRDVAASLAGPTRLYVGETGALRTTIVAPTLRGGVDLELLLDLGGPAPAATPQTVRLDAPQVEATTLLRPTRRGRVEIAALWLRWRGPLGLTERFTRVALDRGVDVVPNVRGVAREGLRLIAQDAIHGQKQQRDKGEGAEFEALRDYAPGLDHRFMDWKRSARARKLLCKEFRIERNHQIVLAFDTGHLMQETVSGLTRLDHAIHAGLLLAWVSLKTGDLTGAWAFDAAVRAFSPPGAGMTGFARLQTALARLDYHPYEANFTLGLAELNARLGRRALVVLFTDFVDTTSAELLIESIAAMSNRHAVLFVTLKDRDLETMVDAAPGSFHMVAQAVVAQDFLHERALVFERLRRLGVFCLDADVASLSADLVNRYLAIKRRGALG